MKKKINQYLEKTIEDYKNGISIDNILLYLRDEKVPPGYSSIILVGILEIKLEDAYAIVYSSEAYRDLKETSDLLKKKFFDDLESSNKFNL